jgi:hypothetical protein
MPAPLSPTITSQIVDGLAAGKSHREVGRLLGIDHSTVTARAKGMRALIEAQSLDYFSRNVQLSTAINTTCLEMAQLIYAEASTMPFWCRSKHLADNSAALAQAHKISDRILQSVGIAPSQAPSIVVQQFVQINQAVLIDPRVTAAIGQAQVDAIQGDSDVIDVDVDSVYTGEGEL